MLLVLAKTVGQHSYLAISGVWYTPGTLKMAIIRRVYPEGTGPINNTLHMLQSRLLRISLPVDYCRCLRHTTSRRLSLWWSSDIRVSIEYLHSHLKACEPFCSYLSLYKSAYIISAISNKCAPNIYSGQNLVVSNTGSIDIYCHNNLCHHDIGLHYDSFVILAYFY